MSAPDLLDARWRPIRRLLPDRLRRYYQFGVAGLRAIPQASQMFLKPSSGNFSGLLSDLGVKLFRGQDAPSLLLASFALSFRQKSEFSGVRDWTPAFAGVTAHAPPGILAFLLKYYPL